MNIPSTAVVSTAHLTDPGSVVEHTAGSGLRIVAVRRPSVPVVELRLAVPFGGEGSAHAATAEVLAAVLLGSTRRRDRTALDTVLGLAGGSLRASVTPERLTVQGAVAADGLRSALEAFGDALADPQRPPEEVETYRTRLGHRLHAYRARPATAAREAVLEHCFPGHPLAHEVPRPQDVAAVEDADVAALHARALVPGGSRLLLVGDLDPAAAVAAAEHALGAWTGPHTAAVMPELPVPAGGVAARSRPGSRQVQIRLLAPAPVGEDPRHPAVRLANLVLGASFGSRLTERLREREGLTYGVHTSLADHPGRGLLTLDLDTSPARLGAALAALREELDRFATDSPPDEDEIAAARSYAVGSLVVLSAAQNGTANLLHALPVATRQRNWLAEQVERISRTKDSEVRAAAGDMAAARFHGIVLTAPTAVDQAAREVEAAGFLPAPPVPAGPTSGR
ncbi:M16 family metallopeptidase [Streptacidiphilus sp. N1-3]|uniref:M16 family metallopeptidase n=1 Tax=Streptacidiphilus alkalitolerans TaxID=3342712 RepID=A0ABV6X241_9ACTN